MAPDFSQPQRQSPIGVLVMFADTARHFVRALWPLLVVWIFNSKTLSSVYVVPSVVAIFVLISIGAYLRWRNFSFYLDDQNEEFVISEGVFNKTKTVIALDKIQQVNINQSLIQRIIGVYGLEIDTAGSQAEEGKIKAVKHHLALALKARLLENDRKRIATDAPDQAKPVSDGRPFMEIGLLSLIKVGVTSNYIKTFWLIFVFIVTVYDNLRHLFEGNFIDAEKIDQYVGQRLATNTIAMLFMFTVVLILLINLIRTVVRYYGYRISQQSGSLMLSFGLINTKSTIIKPEKVQIVTITRNYFQKKMNILGIRIRQATSGQEELKDQHIDIPGCDEKERDAILNLLYRVVPEKGVMLKPNYRKLVFSIFLSIVLPLSVFFIIAQASPLLYDYAFLTWLYALLVLLVLVFGFRNYRLFIGQRFIIKQSGAWDVSNEIVEPAKIQAITTSQLFWHKGVDIGYMTLHTAGGNISFALGNFTKIKAYVNLWLYEMESSDVNWM
jgi:uncharacterized membrane protein YdbT with pleckstrin-like domain